MPNSGSVSNPDSFGVYSQKGAVTIPLIMATILIFIHLGRPFDQVLVGLHIPAVICSVAIIIMFFTKWLPTLKSRAGIGLVLFIVALCVASVFSIWRGGSVAYVQQYVQFNLVVFCLVAATPTSVGNVRWLGLAVLISCTFDILIGATFDSKGRLQIKDSSLGNSDDVALMGGICIPFVLLFAGRMNKILGAIFGLVGVVACLAAILLSGTRFALVAVAVMALLYFLRGSATKRIGLLACFAIFAIGAVFVLPKATLDRLSTITAVFNSDEANAASYDPENPSEAIGSLQERRQLTLDGLNAFFTHPLFGVGPNAFTSWRWDTFHLHGMMTHNTYLHAAAEEGLPGVVFYVMFLVGALATAYKCAKPYPGWEDGRDVSLAVETSLVYFMVSAFSLTCVAHTHQFVLAGMVVALERLRTEKVAEAEIESPEARASNEAEGRTSLGLPTKPVLPKSLPPRSAQQTGVGQPISAPAAVRPERYRFNRPVTTSSSRKRE